MQSTALVSVLLILSFTGSVGATDASNISCLVRQGQKPADPVRTIRQRFTTINQEIRRYRKVKKELSGFSAEGGELVAYLDGRAIVKIVATYYGETGRTLEEYYYWNGGLIFVLRKELTYDKPLSGKVVRTREDRFYFENRRLIKWIDQEAKQISSADPEFSKQQQEYLDSSEQFLKGARAKAPTIEAP